MKKGKRRLILVGFSIAAVSAALLVPGSPWSAQCRHFIKRLVTKADMTVAAWQGAPTELISLKGKVVRKKVALRGAEVEVLDSISGWAGLSDEVGAFVVRDVAWYAGAGYTLIVAANDYQSRSLNLQAPANRPPGGVLDLGELEFDSGCRVELAALRGRNSITTIAYDEKNSPYYRRLFDELTEGKIGDDEKISAISRYVSGRLEPGSTEEGVGPARRVDSISPREVFERGSRYCGQLAVALATLAEAGDYRARVLDLIDTAEPLSTHMVTEVFYGDRWHLYDPLMESTPLIANGRIASYTELRVDVDLALPKLAREHLPGFRGGGTWITDLYRSGLHHYYYVRR